MTSRAPQAIPENDNELVRITDDFDEPGEVTGVRRIVRSTIDELDYPARPDRIVNFDKTPIEQLEHELEAQVDQWAYQRMLKTQITAGSDVRRNDITERVLRDCQAKGKIHAFEVSTGEDKKSAYTIYYRYKTS